jgi:hypothetical protein
MLGVSTTGYNL